MMLKPRLFRADCIQITDTKAFITPFGQNIGRHGDWAFPVQDALRNYVSLFENDMMQILFKPIPSPTIENGKFEIDSWTVTLQEDGKFEIDTGMAVDEYDCIDDLAASIDRLSDVYWILTSENERIKREKEIADLKEAQEELADQTKELTDQKEERMEKQDEGIKKPEEDC